MVDLVRAGRDPAALAREFEPTARSISHWGAQAERQEGRREEQRDVLTTAEREELARLRPENKQLRLERDILSLDEATAAAGPPPRSTPPVFCRAAPLMIAAPSRR